jgi:hypothetical protein
MATPDGTATANSDAVRQSQLSSFFYATPNLLAGMDSASRLGNVRNDGDGGTGDLLGYGTSFGVDVGVGNNGEVYLRGRTGEVAPAPSSSSSSPSVAGFALSPGLLLLAVAAFLILRK